MFDMLPQTVFNQIVLSLLYPEDFDKPSFLGNTYPTNHHSALSTTLLVSQ